MMHIVLARLRLVLLLLAATACTAGAQEASGNHKLQKIWTLHIDYVKPENVPLFERLCVLQSDNRKTIMTANGLPVKPSYEIATTDARYFTFRGREGFTEFDHPPSYSEAVRKLFAEKVSVFDDSIHGALEKHYNQIWSYDESSSYFPGTLGGRSRPGFVHIRSERVIPAMEPVYDSVMTVFHEALKKINSPLTCCAFYSSYGDGTGEYVWLAENRDQFIREGGRGDILTKAFGEDAADSFMRLWDQCLEYDDDVDAVPRPDLNALDEKAPWFGY